MNNKYRTVSSFCAFLVLTFTLLCAPAIAQTLEIVDSGRSRMFTLSDLQERLRPRTVNVTNGVYDCFLLQDLLALVGEIPAGRVLLFVASDGYKPDMNASDVTDQGCVAYRSHGLPQGFKAFVSNGKEVDPAPYYLVWTGKAADTYPDPYQLIRIEILSDFHSQLARLDPGGPADSRARHGFRLFVDHCKTCHSINSIGGEKGPELNGPMNITEYFDKKVLRQYIRKPTSVRLGAVMQPSQLSDEEIDLVIEYLEAMKGRKAVSAN